MLLFSNFFHELSVSSVTKMKSNIYTRAQAGIYIVWSSGHSVKEIAKLPNILLVPKASEDNWLYNTLIDFFISTSS